MKQQHFTSSAVRMRPLAAACLLALLATGCASPSHTISPEAQANAARENPAPPKDEDFPAIESAKWKQGAFPSIEALRAMRTGMGKDQVRELLSYPHFSEGIGGVREWNYIFHFRTGAGPDYITCQYMVRFNQDVLTTGGYWKGRGCADMVKPAVVAPVLVPAPPVAAVPRKVTLGADGLFRFDGGHATDLLPEGRRKIEALATDIRQSGDKASITVIGHTDRLGSDDYNNALSLERANTVRGLLVQQGVAGTAIRAAGAGKQQPVVQCAGTAATPELVSCLQPNRRVEIEVSTSR
ncbi:OmpA family protein [Variovorax guangxiensis]|uniref:Outer membrane protein assembly factor BamE n=1 Tax=Variovorax guangxiensis TaxID=1775474 RepID=A0A502DF48_9BURK|nr:OmpA family protein [Variovorax guangxiensis]TPG18961.1 outer membrane protein assembly factor BamE [Variovorax ginsengisoli]TPG23793.1 outer membrane protein assembly factor BamE [Variovorax guangxiensis]